MSPDDREVVERYFGAMRRKREGIEDLVALFADDAVYTEPFSAKTPATHTGKAEIGAFLRAMPENAPPDMEVSVDRIDRDGARIRAEWTCTSQAFPQPMRGVDLYDVKDGKISRLETSLKESSHG